MGIDYRRLKDFCDFYAANLPALGIPMGKIYYALPCAGVLIILYGLLNIVDALKAIHSATDTTEHTLEKSHD